MVLLRELGKRVLRRIKGVMMICVCCGRDMDEIGLDNVSPVLGVPLCEDCVNSDEAADLISEHQSSW